ncbi:conserved hypothetical protein [Roseibium sp. TrichSKD4]|uniref:hypothetical protein n=1 Tax=Roseibium sp. TrichSKD4 TaxID=744980 RepID=UPI0001E5761D|nr:hypothetical protein [Roseibium sp. TrichSKD4]EFO30964.1 conserved hypothetical protein [Roseibium sp. TrichSKD4]
MKIVQLEAKAIHTRRGFEHFWKVMQEFNRQGQSFSVDDILAKSDQDQVRNIRDLVSRLLKSGHLAEVSADSPKRFMIARNEPFVPRVRRDGTIAPVKQDHIWAAIRMQRQWFTVQDIFIFTQHSDAPPTEQSIASYVTRLKLSGYLSVQADPRKVKPTRYFLKPSMNTGPRAPRVIRSEGIYDPNKQQVMGLLSARELQS